MTLQHIFAKIDWPTQVCSCIYIDLTKFYKNLMVLPSKTIGKQEEQK